MDKLGKMKKLILLIILFSSPALAYNSIKISPEHVGVFLENNTQQFTAYGLLDSGEWEDITNKVDWYIEENGFEGQDIAENTVKIAQNGIATGLKSWGRVNVSVCYPVGCKIKPEPPEPPTMLDFLPSIYNLLFSTANASEVELKATTSMTLMNVTNWKVPPYTPVLDRAIASMPVKTKITSVKITYSRISWQWSSGFDGLLWAFWTENGGITWNGWGWDYVTANHYLKAIEGYKRGWVGTAIGSCGECDGYPQRTTVFFTETY